jgi:hypothetical protein
MKTGASAALLCAALLSFAAGAGVAEGVAGGPAAAEGARARPGAPAAFAPPEFSWKGVVFGQSTNASDNSVVVNPDGSVVISSLNGKGKVTGSHDGIAYYYAAFDPSRYNFTLSAEIEVLTFANDGDPAKTKPNNQEGFGIMLRDAIGAPGNDAVFASNLVYAGGYRGQTQAVMREGVGDQSAAGARMEARSLDPRLPGKGTRYALSIRKSNTGFHVRLNDDPATEAVFYRPRLLSVQDPERLYAGFFAARNASIRVSGIRISFSDPAADPPAVAEPPRPVDPALAVKSLADTPLENYKLVVSPNVDGVVSIAVAGAALAQEAKVRGGEDFAQSLALVPGENAIEILFTPAQGQPVTSASPVRKAFKVTRRSLAPAGTPVYAAPAGLPEGDGSRERPLDLATALKYVLPGQSLVLLGGTYSLASPLVIARGNDGEAGALKSLEAEAGARVVLDFGGKGGGLQVLGSRWRIAGIEATRSSGAGIRLAGSGNVLERCGAVANANTGIQISGSSAEPRELWPADNLVLSCWASDNCDAAEEDADGFAAKLAVGPGNVFRHCLSSHNCDDGWDLYTKRETGAIGPVLVDSCVALGNGVLSDGRKTRGDGNGFKLGGEGVAVANLARGCVSYGNAAAGFTANSNPAVRLEDCVACDNGGANFDFGLYEGSVPAFSLKGLYSLRLAASAAASLPADALAAGFRAADIWLFDGAASVNAAGKPLDTSLFAGLKAPAAPGIGADGKPALDGYLELRR